MSSTSTAWKRRWRALLSEQALEGTYPDHDKPDKVISTYFYGDHIHWSAKKGHADVVAEREKSPFDDASYRHEFLKAAMGLAHLYIGYGEVIHTVARRSLH